MRPEALRLLVVARPMGDDQEVTRAALATLGDLARVHVVQESDDVEVATVVSRAKWATHVVAHAQGLSPQRVACAVVGVPFLKFSRLLQFSRHVRRGAVPHVSAVRCRVPTGTSFAVPPAQPGGEHEDQKARTLYTLAMACLQVPPASPAGGCGDGSAAAARLLVLHRPHPDASPLRADDAAVPCLELDFDAFTQWIVQGGAPAAYGKAHDGPADLTTTRQPLTAMDTNVQRQQSQKTDGATDTRSEATELQVAKKRRRVAFRMSEGGSGVALDVCLLTPKTPKKKPKVPFQYHQPRRSAKVLMDSDEELADATPAVVDAPLSLVPDMPRLHRFAKVADDAPAQPMVPDVPHPSIVPDVPQKLRYSPEAAGEGTVGGSPLPPSSPA